MTVKTTYTCDKCGADCPGGKQYWRISIFASCHPTLTLNNFSDPRFKQEICRSCLEAYGFPGISPPPEPGKPAPPPPTIEDIIREIVAQEVENAQ